MSARPRHNANGEGSTIHLPNGRWRALAFATDPFGRRRRLSANGRTKREAEAALLEKVTALGAGTAAGDQTTLGAYLERWLEAKALTAKPRTVEAYGSLLRLHVISRLGELRLERLTPEHLEALYAAIGAVLSAGTVRKAHAVLHAALANAVRRGLVGRNVVDLVDAPRYDAPEGHALSAEEAARLLVAARADPLEALYWLALLTGLRRGELLGLRWSDVEWAPPLLRVRQKLDRETGRGLVESAPKSRASKRAVALVAPAVAALKRHKAHQNAARLAAGERWQDRDLVFATQHGRPLDARNVLADSYYPLLERARLPRVRFHDLRHTTGSLLTDLGTPLTVVRDILGHSQVGVTAKHYIHAMPATGAGALAKLAEALGGEVQ